MEFIGTQLAILFEKLKEVKDIIMGNLLALKG